MKHSLRFEIQPQPDDTSCGPTCLAAVYGYWDDPVELPRLIAEIGQLSGGGTLAVQLACHALQRGYEATITTYNLQIFDPTWFTDRHSGDPQFLLEKLQAQYELKRGRPRADDQRLQVATEFYQQFLRLGGRLQMQDLDETLIVRSLSRGLPLLCGLSATYLYQEPRERVARGEGGELQGVPDDVGGDPVGHFVVLHGYDPASGRVAVADPMHLNP
ncbi:MAG: hypothetical protein D6753_16830, partial [Planctomycetota bacterium]